MTKDERKENLKKLFDELTNMPEKEKMEEFASMVYAKCAIMQLIDTIREHYKDPEVLEKESANWGFLTKVVGVAATYGAMGVEMGYAEERGKDVCE